MSENGVNSAAPTTSQPVGGVYSATPPVLKDGQAAALQLDINGKLITSGGGGGGSDVNIIEIAGSPVGLTNPLAVELSDGTNPLGTSTNPIFVGQAPANTASAPSQQTVGGSSGSILASNALRIEATIINTGTTPIYLGLGQTPTATAYHICLAACSTANDGTGGTYTTDVWKGTINAISASSGTVCVTELTA